MTPEEKAKDLFNKMLEHCWYNTFPTDRYGVSRKVTTYRDNEAKQCALIATNEIIENIPMYTGNLNPKWKYWDDVRTALNAI